MSLRHYVT